MLRRRLLQLAGIAITSAVLATQNVARSETTPSSGLLRGRPSTGAALTSPRQGAGPPAILAGAKPLPLLIDGSKTPELISDSVAFGHFVRVTAVPTDMPDEALTRQRLVLAPLQLSDLDRQVLLQTLQSVRESLDQLEMQRRAVSRSSAERRATIGRLAQEEAQTFENARGHLDRVLTPAGASRLNAYLRTEVKRRIKAYGTLPR